MRCAQSIKIPVQYTFPKSEWRITPQQGGPAERASPALVRALASRMASLDAKIFT